MPTTTGTPARPPRAGRTAKAMRTRTDIVRAAIAFDLRGYGDGYLPADQMYQARHEAASSIELHLILRRLWEAGVLDRQGRGYHQGDPYRYRLATGAQ